MTERGRHLGEMLRSAREGRGVDRRRAEHDTRILERHLAALEEGEYDELPGDVYARGFVRSYARYLGLDPDTMVALYRIETRDRHRAGGAAVERAVTPRARRAPRAFALNPSVVVAAVLTMFVGAIAAYLAYQVITYARTPELRVVDPPGDVRGHTSRAITIRGVTEPNARVSVSGLAENPSVVAGPDGGFELRLELLPGSNLVTIAAFDPRTSRAAPSVTRTIEVVAGADGGESRSRNQVMTSTRSRWLENRPSTS